MFLNDTAVKFFLDQCAPILQVPSRCLLYHNFANDAQTLSLLDPFLTFFLGFLGYFC